MRLIRVYFGRQSGIRIFVARNLKCPILLKLLDHCVGDQHFNMRDKRMVFESWDGDRVDVAKVIGLYRPNVVAQTTNQETDRRGLPQI